MSTARSTARPTSSRPTSSAPSCCWRRRGRTAQRSTPARRAAFRFHHVSTDEVFGALGAGRSAVHRGHRLRPAQPLFGQQGGVRPSGAGLAPHLRPADHRLQHGQQLRPVAVPGEADPAGHAERAGGQAAAGLRRRLELPRLAVRRGPRRGAGPRCWSAAQPGATYAIGARQPRSNLEVVRAICAELDRRVPDPAGPRERLIRFVTDRPGPRFPLRDRPDAAPRRRWTGRRRTISSAGLARTIDWYLAQPRLVGSACAPARYAGQRLGVQPGPAENAA